MDTKYDFHNPANLTPDQVGEGYRLLLKSEIKGRKCSSEIGMWLPTIRVWEHEGVNGSCEKSIYRAPLATWPLPELEDQSTDWIEWHGGECPLKDDEVEEWEYKTGQPNFIALCPPSSYIWNHRDDESANIAAYRVLKWKKKEYAMPTVKSPEVDELQDRFSLPDKDSFAQAILTTTKRESAPTDNDCWKSLLATNARLGREVAELKRSRDEVSDYQDELEAKLKTAETRLAELEWIPFSEREPMEKDADCHGMINVSNGYGSGQWSWDCRPDKSTHWRPFGFKKPDPFEEWWNANSSNPISPKEAARIAFEAGRDSK